MNSEKIIYSISINDIHQVATHVLNRHLTKMEITEISDKVGDYIDWHQAVENAISDVIFKRGN